MCGGYSTCLIPGFHDLKDVGRGVHANYHIVNRDDFISKYRMTNLTKEEIVASTVTG